MLDVKRGACPLSYTSFHGSEELQKGEKLTICPHRDPSLCAYAAMGAQTSEDCDLRARCSLSSSPALQADAAPL